MRKFFLIASLLFLSLTLLAACNSQPITKPGEATILVRPNPRYIDTSYVCVDGDSIRLRLADEKPICMVSNQARKLAYMEIYKNGRLLAKVMNDPKATLVVGNYEVLLRDRVSGEVISRVKINCYI